MASNMDEPLANLLFEFPGADIIIRSHDSHHFRVPKCYIVNSSPLLNELVHRALDPSDHARGEALLPVVQLPEIGEVLHSLLTFIFPVTPVVPSATKKAMKLLSVAQKYQMDSVLAYIRYHIARQNPPSAQRDTALRIYALAQKFGLHQEALQAAQTLLKYSMNIGDLQDKLDVMPGASLHELWKYYKVARDILKCDLTEFRTSGARGTFAGLQCVELSSSQIPRWLNDYIASIGDSPILFDLFEFNTALAHHVGKKGSGYMCGCRHIPSQTIRNFWEALESVVNGSFKKAESALSLVRDYEDSHAQINPITTLPKSLEVPDANIIIRSSDLVDFRIHKLVLAIVSPIFRDILSLPQPYDSEFLDVLPVVQVSEDAGLLTSLISMLYPVPPVAPDSYQKVLYLLAACQKYDMVHVQYSIRTEVNRGSFPAPVGTDTFRAYAIARVKGLVPEMEKAARLTLDYPMTFETVGEGLRLFKGSALRNLARFRKRCRDSLVLCLDSFLDVQGPSAIWVGCPEVMPNSSSSWWYLPQTDVLPNWLRQVLSRNSDLKQNLFSDRLVTPSNIRAEYMTAIQSHASCSFCSGVHMMKGSAFCMELENKMALAVDKAQKFFFDEVPENGLPAGIGNTSDAVT